MKYLFFLCGFKSVGSFHHLCANILFALGWLASYCMDIFYIYTHLYIYIYNLFILKECERESKRGWRWEGRERERKEESEGGLSALVATVKTGSS